MANYKEIWTPRLYPAKDYGALDRPGENVSMFHQHDSNTWTHQFTDSYTGDKVNFGNTLSSSDNLIRNLQDCWKQTSGYGVTHCKCKLDNYASWHIGAIPVGHRLDRIKACSQHMLPGYTGVRFQYRWPMDNSRNYWSNSPVHINDMMLHYYDANNDTTRSYAATLWETSTSTTNYWPDRFVNDDNRRNDSWKGCFYCPNEGGARSEIRNEQLFMIGMSVEMKYSNRGSATHSRCMDIRNLTPIWDRASGHGYTPVMAKPAEHVWSQDPTKRSKLELYTV